MAARRREAVRPSARRVEHSDDTRRALLDAARTAFADKGYAETSLEDIVVPARLTKGALYHHFANKAAVLEALYIEMEQVLVQQVGAAVAACGDDPWTCVVAAVEAFFAASAEPEYARIVLREAPHVLGDRGRELDQRIGLDLVSQLLEGLRHDGSLLPIAVPAAARAVLAATSELAVTVAHSQDAKRARKEGVEVVLALISGLRKPEARATRAASPGRSVTLARKR